MSARAKPRPRLRRNIDAEGREPAPRGDRSENCMTPGRTFTRRTAMAACAALAIAGQAALAKSSQGAGAIRVDVAPLRANAGDPTATWVERELPRRLAQALAGRVPKGATLTVRIDYLTL